MKETYITPQAEVVTFAPSKAIALNPDWGFEEDIFGSDPEPKMVVEDEDAERRVGYEG